MIKKIESAKIRAKKEKKKQQILSGVMILILLLSVAGYANFSGVNEDNKDIRTYGRIELYEDNGFWKTSIDQKEFIFYNLPSNLNFPERINLTISEIQDRPLYLVGNYPSTITYNLKGIALRIQGACVDNETCLNENYPIKDCAEDNILIFVEGNDSIIYQEGKCVYLEGDLLKVSDKFIYKILGIEL